uniref:ATP synthase F0 subunit 8 n=1 Tax=Helota thoracica TaxID=3031831 RepID=UPI0023F4220F|nr:ATP synthase F0 subunit 8 [Helota thoracica]WEA76630.1 ATP synthase subunit 8 [Helota thoracica]
MPQMMPLNWVTLFIFFSMTLIITNSINYYSFMYNIKKFKTFKKKINLNWKW